MCFYIHALSPFIVLVKPESEPHSMEIFWICLQGGNITFIPLYLFDLSDGEGHVRREPWPHPDPRAHPHHDRPGELLLPGACLQTSQITDMYAANEK